MGKNGLVHGVGVNDADYVLNRRVYTEGYTESGNRKQISVWKCPYYVKWVGMLERCYSPKWHKKKPSYADCSVCEEWLLFSNFKIWMSRQDWEGKQLDKDIIVERNKVYSPENCVFVGNNINGFLKDRGNDRGKYLLGVGGRSSGGLFLAMCSNPFKVSRFSGYIGSFFTEVEAHLAWKKQKHLYACQLADSEYVTDKRVAEALRNRYKNYTIFESHIDQGGTNET